MACVNEGSHSITRHPHIYPQVVRTIPAFIPQPQSVTALWPLLIFSPTEGRRLSWPECRVTNRGGFTHPQKVTHPSTNRARRRVTSLIETNVLPLSQAAASSNKPHLASVAIRPNNNMCFNSTNFTKNPISVTTKKHSSHFRAHSLHSHT